MSFYQNKLDCLNKSDIHLRTIKLVIYGSITISDACLVLSCSRTTIWRLRTKLKKFGILYRSKKPKNRQAVHNKTPKYIEDKIIYLRNKYFIGADNIKPILDRFGIYLTRITIYRILKRNNLIRQQSQGKKNYLRYTLGYPGAEVQIDFTQIEDSKERFWIASAIDDHTRWGWAKVYPRCNAKYSQDFLQHIIDSAPFPIQAVRTDQGSEFRDHFSAKCSKLNIIHIKNRAYTPRHNGKVERFHRTIQEECLWYQWHFKLTSHQAIYKLNIYLGFYNYHRYHQGLNMQCSPFEKLTRYIQNNLYKDHAFNVSPTMIRYNY